jgi:hypothetical protein
VFSYTWGENAYGSANALSKSAGQHPEKEEAEMKIRNTLAISTVLALAAMIGAPSAAAQSQGLRADIPFEFRADGQLLPAGTYTITKVTPVTLRLENARGHGWFIAAGPESVRMIDHNLFVFHKYGNQSFLAGAYWSGSAIRLNIPPSRAEREVARIAGRQERVVTIAAR